MRKKKQILIAFICALGFPAALSLPSALAAWDDWQLLHTAAVRPAVAGTLSQKARDLPTAYALYRRRQLSGSQPLEHPAEPGAAAPLLAEKTRALHDAGVLSESLYTEAIARLSAADTASQSRQDGFSFAMCAEAPKGESPSDTVEAEWIDATGIATRYRITGISCKDDPQDLLEAYQIYLGLQTLTDWQPLSSDLFADGTITAWSAEGQIYLYCCTNEQGLQLGAVSFSKGDF